ncbi:related to NUP49 - nuclear pore protein [Ustilago trichophora]|uniref:Related to NUP49 - nuclear pore protein n=1 Tax=Ustilago trichophora TaxID=86804 RepID=A0A5C3DYD6_9BASI|nr:related to NUP49 - nuclear pore protein [Ustilago trichophora]
MFGSTPAASTGSTLGRSASFSFSQPPANKPFSGTSGGFSFGGGANSTTSAATTNTATAAAAPATGGFSFGAKPATTTAAPATGGLFGSSTNTQQQPVQQQQQQQTQPQTGFGAGLFGSSNTASTSNSLFGSKPNPPAAGGFSFGNITTNNTASTSTGGGLFGSSTQPAQQQQPSNSLFSFGGSQPQQQQQQQANNAFQPFQAQQQNQAAASPFARFGYFQKERFNDLPDDARKLVEELENHISTQTQLRDELKTKTFGDEIRKCAAEWHELDSALKSLSATLDTDEKQSADVGRLLERDRATTSTLYSIIVNAKEPRATPASSDGASFVEWLEHFFSDLALEYRDRISRYSSTVETIQHHLQSLSSRETYTPQAISDAIHAQHESFMTLAGQVAALHAEVDALKKDYAKWYKQVNRSVRDPFGSMNALAGSVPPAS